MTARRKPEQDTVEFFDVEQRSEEWHKLKRGIPSASKFSTVLAEGKDGEDSVGRLKYMRQLAGEILTGEVAETFRNETMDRGVAMEPEAREWYARTRFVELRQVGFARRTVHTALGNGFLVGASPDSLIEGTRKALEIKTMRPDLLVEVAQKGASGFPSKHRAQCQGVMWVLDYEQVDLVLYYRGWRSPPVFTVERDPVYIGRLAAELERFSFDLRRLVDQVKATGKGW